MENGKILSLVGGDSSVALIQVRSAGQVGRNASAWNSRVRWRRWLDVTVVWLYNGKRHKSSALSGMKMALDAARRQQIVDRIANRIAGLGMTAPAVLFLEM